MSSREERPFRRRESRGAPCPPRPKATHASCGSTAAGPSWAWRARCSYAARRPGPRWTLPGRAAWQGPSRAAGRCSEGEPRAGGWRAEGAGPLAAAEGAPGRTGLRPCPGPGAAGGAAAEAGAGAPGWPSPTSALSSTAGHSPPRHPHPQSASQGGASATTAAPPRPWPSGSGTALLPHGSRCWAAASAPDGAPARRSLSEHVSRARQDTRVAHAGGSPAITPPSLPLDGTA